MTDDELRVIIEKHERWLNGQEGGECANLCGATICGADLRDADLRRANLCDANLYGANLYGAYLCFTNFRGAHLCCADLCRADLRNADLRDANLRGADLGGADLGRADLRGSNLCLANLLEANLCNADLYDAKDVPFIPMSCPDIGSFTAWKKARGYIVKLLIPEDARRSSSTGRKCRCDKAIVIAIETLNGEPAGLDEIASDYDDTFIYKIGETVTVPNFCEDRFKGCADGIHFFINRQEAVDYH